MVLVQGVVYSQLASLWLVIAVAVEGAGCDLGHTDVLLGLALLDGVGLGRSRVALLGKLCF